MVNVNNGTATVPVDTTGLTGGEYKLQTTYTDGNYYENAYTDTSILTLNDWTVIDCSNRDNFTPDHGTLTIVDGHVRATGSNAWVIANLPITKGMVIQGQIAFNDTNMGVPLLSAPFSNYQFFGRWDNTRLMDSHGTVNQKTISSMSIQNGLQYQYVIDENGYITYTDNYGVSETSNSAYSDTLLGNMHLQFIQWSSSAYIDILSLKYKYNSNGGGESSQLLASNSLLGGVCA